MSYSDFVIAILKVGGTWKDADRLNREGYENAMDAHEDLFDNGELEGMTEEEFTEYCYYIGRQFVLDNLGEIFFLEGSKQDV